MTESFWFGVSLLILYLGVGAIVGTVLVIVEIHNDRGQWREEWGSRTWAYVHLWFSAFLLWPMVVIPRN